MAEADEQPAEIRRALGGRNAPLHDRLKAEAHGGGRDGTGQAVAELLQRGFEALPGDGADADAGERAKSAFPQALPGASRDKGFGRVSVQVPIIFVPGAHAV